MFLTFTHVNHLSAPSMPPANITAFNTSSTSLRITWSEVPENHRNEIVRQYRLFYQDTDWQLGPLMNVTVPTKFSQQSNLTNMMHNWTSSPSTHEQYSVNLTGLNIFRIYTIQLQAITVAAGNISEPLRVRTDEDSTLYKILYNSF